MEKSRSLFAFDSLLLLLLILPQLSAFPVFFYPTEPTFFDRMSPSFRRLLLQPSNSLVNNPISLMLVTLLFGAVILYLLIDLLVRQPERRVSGDRLRTILVWLIIMVLTVIPVCWQMLCRYQVEPWRFSHDGGVLQTEEAIRCLLLGKNPYTENYIQTLMFQYARGNPNDPPLHHFPYMPWITVASIPAYLVCDSLFNWYDQRLVYLLLFLLTLPAIAALAQPGTGRRSMLLAYALNPFLLPFLAEGRNDIFPLSWLIFSFFLFSRRRLVSGALCLGLACASKQFAILAVPFVALAMWQLVPGRDRAKVFTLRIVLPFALVFVMIVGPFVIWDFHSFKDDVWDFNAGRSEINYALGGTPGYGLGNLPLYLGWVTDRNQYFPFWPLQLLFGIPLLALLLRRQYHRGGLRFAAGAAAVLLLVLGYTARLLHDNHIGFMAVLVIISVFGDVQGMDGPRPAAGTGDPENQGLKRK